MKELVWSVGGMILMGKLENPEKPLFQCHFLHHGFKVDCCSIKFGPAL
jgi:hypothetical protein